MTNAQHTPGPWGLHVGSDYIRISDSKGNDVLADIIWPVYDKTDMANAHLMAAAPELLEALESIFDAASTGFVGRHDECLADARAAIAKAKGE